jgi:mRNA interferase MazF
VRRGDVFRLRLGRRQGHEQSGVRYGVIVQSDALLRLSTVLIAPTSTVARGASFRPEIEIDGSTTRVLVEQTGAVDVSRLGAHHGHLTVEEQWGVDLALENVLDLR